MSSTNQTDPLAALVSAVETITGTPADRVGAPDTGRTAVVNTYGAHTVDADDRSAALSQKVQIDVYVTDPEDDLPWRIMEALVSLWLPYRVEDLNSYDPETNRLRTILQTEVC